MTRVIIDGVEYTPIEKPKPLLADAQVGWICKLRNGGYTQIIDTNYSKFYPFRCKNGYSYSIDGYIGTATAHASIAQYDIIHTEPLATEGTAEWAWQMLMLQKPVVHPAEGELKDTYYTKEAFVRCMAKTGWQLYEEKPKYKVGDWVEFNPGNNPTQIEIVEIDGDKLYYNTRYAGKTIETNIYASAITRKLAPSEVKVKITLEGTVSEPVCDGSVFLLWTGSGTHKHASVVQYADLDPTTRSFVESLLKAQEEKNNG